MGFRRNSSLDVAKGLCVLGMTIGHSFNYFAPAGSFIYHQMLFITGSFVFITGYIISNISLNKYLAGGNLTVLGTRLFTRSLKLLGIFIFSNLAIQTILKRNTVYPLLDYLHTMFILGDYRIYSFSLILIIAYVLMLISIGILVFRKYVQLLVPIIFMVFLYVTTRYFSLNGGYNLRFVTIGMMGFAIGFFDIEYVHSILRNQKRFMIIYVPLIVAIAFSPLYYPVYFTNVIINLLLFYMIGMNLKSSSAFKRKLILVGNYSLLAYLMQMLVLNILREFITFIPEGNLKSSVSSVIVLFATYYIVKVVNYLYNYNTYGEKIYKMIFA